MLMKKSFVIKGTGRDLDSRIVESIRHLESEIILETEQADTRQVNTKQIRKEWKEH